MSFWMFAENMSNTKSVFGTDLRIWCSSLLRFSMFASVYIRQLYQEMYSGSHDISCDDVSAVTASAMSESPGGESSCEKTFVESFTAEALSSESRSFRGSASVEIAFF
jgi:hypothetical protein